MHVDSDSIVLLSVWADRVQPGVEPRMMLMQGYTNVSMKAEGSQGIQNEGVPFSS